MRVGLSNFLRFISASGASKVNKVIEAQQEYREWKDFYKDFREGVLLSLAKKDTERLEAIVSGIEARKFDHYQNCLLGYQKWLSVTDFKVISFPKSESWESGGARISVNPEVVIEIDGTKYLVKLYMSQETLSQPARRAYAWLVAQTHGGDYVAALLEIRKGKLIVCTSKSAKIGQWLKGEAATFVALWNMNRAA